MLFKRNEYDTTNLLDKLVKGQRVIVAFDNEYAYYDSLMFDDDVISRIGIGEDSFSAYVEILLDIKDLQDEYPDDSWGEIQNRFLENYDSLYLQDRGICKSDGTQWTDEEVEEWYGIVCDADLNVYNDPPERTVARQLDLLVGGDWGYENHGVYTLYADQKNGDVERWDEIVAEIKKNYDEYISGNYVVHVYNNPAIEDIGFYIREYVNEFYGEDIDWGHIVVDEKHADEIIEDYIWNAECKNQEIYFNDLVDDLHDELGLGYADAKVMVSALIKLGCKVTY